MLHIILIYIVFYFLSYIGVYASKPTIVFINQNINIIMQVEIYHLFSITQTKYVEPLFRCYSASSQRSQSHRKKQRTEKLVGRSTFVSHDDSKCDLLTIDLSCARVHPVACHWQFSKYVQ